MMRRTRFGERSAVRLHGHGELPRCLHSLLQVGPAIRQSRKRRGQTLIIALIILGVLLVIGFIFLGVVNRNILATSRQQQRTLASDLAEAGIRYAHSQLLNTELGADWRGGSTPPIASNDPDSDLLKPAPGVSDPTDLGGPDRLGPYTRINFQSGRALVRVRYAPADPSLFNISQNPATSLRQPGKAHNYLLIESYGRPGRVNANDPTQISAARTGNQKKLIAMVSIGVIETARFITNKFNVSRPAELGVPASLGIQYASTPVAFPLKLGGSATLPNFDGTNTMQDVAGFGSLYSNAQLKIYGEVDASLAAPLGDQIAVADTIIGADDQSTLKLAVTQINTSGVWQTATSAIKNWAMTNASAYADNTPPTVSTSSLDSGSASFGTAEGLLRDGVSETDEAGFARGVGRKEPPSILTPDPDTGEPRYVSLTRESGKLVGDGNSGRFGHGRGVYVDNLDDRQMRVDETGRANVGTAESLVYDWLNPNNGQANSGWQGPFYVPRGAFLKLLSDGFVITRDGKAPASQRTWRNPDGTDTGSTKIRYRIGNVPDGSGNPVPYIVDSFTTGIDINGPLTSDDYKNHGFPFNGVLYFGGNVRVRGTIPTDVQMLVVSNATIYVEGSITKGVVGNDYTDSLAASVPPGTFLTRPSASTIGLFAKDYVALNTTQFFGPDFNQSLEAVKDVPTAVGFNPIRMRTGGGILNFIAELLLDPTTGTVGNPQSWTPFANGYKDAVTNSPLPAGLLLTQTMDDGPGANAFLSMNVNPGLSDSTSSPNILPPYLFAESGAGVYNSASAYYPPGYMMPNPPYAAPAAGYVPMYGLGNESWQRYPKFETMKFPLVDDGSTFSSTSPNTAFGGLLSPIPAHGQYQMPLLGFFQPPATSYDQFAPQSSNEFQFYPNSVGSVSTNDLLFARAAITPHDVRIEAVMYAEEGSFFVIPGPPFNPNPNDTREGYASLGATDSERQLARLENFGTGPDCPFYNEPLDVRIQIVGAVSENMPPPINQQAEWLKRWGWIPGLLGATGNYIPSSHADGATLTSTSLVPNLIISYDPTLGTARAGNSVDPANNPPVRVDSLGRTLPPIPRLPVSPTLAYFGEVNP